MTEYDNEPVPGLPGHLPPGERILWQGSPDWRALARTAFHTRTIAIYFVVLAVIAVVLARGDGDYSGVVMTVAIGTAGVALLHALAWGAARTTIYTLTDRRIVLRIGMAVPKCINLPLTQVASIDLAARGDGTGDLPMTLIGVPKLGYLALWPHARPWRVSTPQPMLRSVPDVARVAALIARTCLAANPGGRMQAVAMPEPTQAPTHATPDFAGAQAA